MEWPRALSKEYYGAPSHLTSQAQPAVSAQERCDRIVARYRTEPALAPLRATPAPPAPPLPTTDTLLLRLGEELDYARRMLDVMGDDLSSDPAIIMRHQTALQSFDIVGQMLGHIANVVRASRRDEAVSMIGMADLRARLVRQSLS